MRWGLLMALMVAVGCRSDGSTAPSPPPNFTQADSHDLTLDWMHDGSTEPTIRLATWVGQTPTKNLPLPSAAGEKISPGKVVLTLDRAIKIALKGNPDFVTRLGDESVSQAVAEVARAYPFAPAAQIEVVPSPRETNGNSAKTLSRVTVTQTFELAHQSRYRRRAGIFQLDRTQWNIEQAAVLLVAETQRRFFATLYQRQLGDVAKTIADLNDKLLGVLQRSFQAGRTSAADVALAQIEASTSRQQAALAMARYKTALLALRVHLGLDINQPVELAGDLAAWHWPTVQSAVKPWLDSPADETQSNDSEHGTLTAKELDQLAKTRPDMLEAEANLRYARAQLDLARSNLVPNLNIGPFFERDEADTQFWGVAAQMPFGVARTSGGTPLVKQRRAEVQRGRIARDQLKRKINLEIQTAALRYTQARQVVEQFSSDVADRLSRDVQQVQDLYEAGQVDLVRLYTARNAVLQFNKSYADALNQLGQAAANLTVATGALPELLPLSERAR